MPVRAVVRHEIEDQLEAAAVRLGQQAVEVRERAEHRVDVGEVSDVVAKVRHR
jgi:hypothetical protein